MRFFALIISLFVSLYAGADVVDEDNLISNPIFKEAAEYYSKNRFDKAYQALLNLELSKKNEVENLRPFIKYWKGVCASRSNEFELSAKAFSEALALKYDSDDIHYQYGQTLFALERYREARLEFEKSLKKNYKPDVSLYYLGYISSQLRDYKKAYKYFKQIEKIPANQTKEVLQASRMQIADILMARAVDHPDEFRVMEEHVIPQYESALEVDKNSNLAPILREKIFTLQRKYDLLLFQLRNGRPVLRPPYFFKISQELGIDSNVIFNPNEAAISRSKQSSEYTRTDVFGRYTFYFEDFISITPELRAFNLYHFNRDPAIHRNDTRAFTGALRTSFEHDLKGRPAAVLFDVDYNETHRDILQKKKLKYNSSYYSAMLGERMNFWNRGETVARLRYRKFDSFNDQFGSKTYTASLEQVIAFKTETILLYASYDRTRVDLKFFDTNSFTFRTDLIISRFHDVVVPIIGLGFTRIDPINDPTGRGVETLINPSARFIRKIGKNWNAILKYDHQKYDSDDTQSFAYRKTVYGLELEYLF